MVLLADFKDSNRRHWEDAELLFGHARCANADHLYGFSAECGLKAIMQKLGMKVDSTGKPKSLDHRKHVQDLWSIFKSFAQTRQGGWYLGRLPEGSPFNNWSHHDRYAHRSDIKETDLATHRIAAQGVRRLINRAEYEGRI